MAGRLDSGLEGDDSLKLRFRCIVGFGPPGGDGLFFGFWLLFDSNSAFGGVRARSAEASGDVSEKVGLPIESTVFGEVSASVRLSGSMN